MEPETPGINTIVSILAEKEIGDKRLAPLLVNTAKIVEKVEIQRSITDWPFENFWDNPREPLHSKLLGYFINPAEKHDCGSYLLKSLLEILKPEFQKSSTRAMPTEHIFEVDDRCQIHVEKKGRIDLLIERRSNKGRYAIIIENKINWAVNQNKQLQGYVKKIRDSGFGNHEIYVCYLPLTEYKEPNEDDIKVLRNDNVCYAKVTFENHILGWLTIVLESEHKWPSKVSEAMCNGMRENLSHYRNLIKYLVNQQKELAMNEDILKLMKQGFENSDIPTWFQVNRLTKAATALQPCFESMLRGKLLLNIKNALPENEKPVFFQVENNEAKPCLPPPVSEFDPCFEKQMAVCLKEDEFHACIGACESEEGSHKFICFKAYFPSSNGDRRIFEEVASESFGDEKIVYGPWNTWAWDNETTYDNCQSEATAERLAKTLLEMRDRLADLLNKGKTEQQQIK